MPRKIVYLVFCFVIFSVLLGYAQEPFVIKDKKFQYYDYRGSCDTDTTIVRVKDNIFEARGGSGISIRKGRLVLWCYGAKHTWIGKLTYAGYTFDSDKDDPLQFMVDEDKGYVYVKGKGTVTMPDGRVKKFQ